MRVGKKRFSAQGSHLAAGLSCQAILAQRPTPVVDKASCEDAAFASSSGRHGDLGVRILFCNNWTYLYSSVRVSLPGDASSTLVALRWNAPAQGPLSNGLDACQPLGVGPFVAGVRSP